MLLLSSWRSFYCFICSQLMRKGKQFSKAASYSLFLLSYPRHIITKLVCEDLQLSSFLCKRTASPLTDCSSITDLLASHSIFAIRFFLRLPTSVKKTVAQNPKEHPHSFNAKEHLLKRWSRRVCLLIGYPLASLNLATFAIEVYCANFCKEKTWWQELSVKRIATSRYVCIGDTFG